MPYHLAMAPNRGGRTCVRRNVGAVDETRTRDLHLGKVALYQLSYYRMFNVGKFVERVMGIEPT